MSVTVTLSRLVLGLSLVTALVGGGGVVLAKVIDCAAGTECIGTNRADEITAGGGNLINGKGGGDTITAGGAGGSDIRGGRGNDVIDAANDVGDAINCGRGKDEVTYDDAL